MKKTLLSGLMLLGALAANAQIADGSSAPQISGNQILSIEGDQVTYGEEISLQAYLDAGKTVVVDMSAAWCAPCWAFHNSKTLEDLYAAYGPDGSDELRIIFIEADPSTNILELDGQSLPPLNGMAERGPSQGDWLAGTTYPVINNDTAAAAYGLEGFPSVYVITPSGTPGTQGTVTNLERDTLGAMVAAINEAIGTEMVGVDNWGRIESESVRSCDATVAVNAYVQGYGHDVTSVEAQLKKDGVVVATQTFTLDLQAFEYGQITFDGVDADASSQYEAVLTQVNGAAALTTEPEFNVSGEFTVTPNAAMESSANITVVLHTDEYPAEMRLFLTKYDDAGQLVGIWNTPTYTNTATYKEKTLTYSIDLNTLDGVTTDTCIGVYMQDSYGDGWDTNTAGAAVTHGVTITSGNGTVLFNHNGTFTGNAVQQDATLKNNGVLGNETFEATSFAVYPNPSNGVFNFNTLETIDVTVVDLTGKTVYTAKGIENGGSMNLSNLQKGMYIAKINSASGERAEKLIIK